MQKELIKNIFDMNKKLDSFILKVSETNVGLERDVKHIKEKVDGIDKKVSDEYVTKTEFNPVKKVVYGLVGTVLLSVVGAVMTIVLK